MTKPFKLTIKSQVTVPKDVRDLLGVGPGDSVSFEKDGDRVVLRKVEPIPISKQTAIADFRWKLAQALGVSRRLPMEMTTDEYMAMIREPVPIPISE